jgi:hypothetical protein
VQTVKGENSDLFIKGHKIHIQTEDWGPEQAVLVSRVFKDGSVHKTFKLAYEKIPQVESDTTRIAAVKKLHQTVIDWSRKEI